MENHSIITIGFCPAWDVACYAENLAWGDHKQLQHQTITPAGKALNVSRALAWMGLRNVAAGLWGQDDYPLLRTQLIDPLVTLEMTPAPGRTRQNITILDTKSCREMHLRAPCTLASPEVLDRLAQYLKSHTKHGDVVVFAGSLPPVEHRQQLFSIFTTVMGQRADIVLDTSGPMYKSIITSFPITLIKPNLEELRALLGKPIEDHPGEIIRAARPLCERVRYVAVSRGENGAIVVTKNTAFLCRATNDSKPAIHTVGCGDFLLAGLVANLRTDPGHALAAGVKAAAARARGLYPAASWNRIEHDITVEMKQF